MMPVGGRKEHTVFGVLFWMFLILGIIIAMMGFPGIYRMITGRSGGSLDHPDSRDNNNKLN